MSENNKKQCTDEFLEDGSRPNDFMDGMAITIVMFIIIFGITYYLATH